jgi:hypothetical protein
MGTNKPIYLIIDTNNIKYIRKYLPKVETLTNIKQNTLSKHFSKGFFSYKNDNWEVIRINNVDLTSNSKGNKYNFINSGQEWD